ncbi:MAG TPA: FAD-dependent oxidoreductase [Solirubrobacteraceae bacterium]|jgi:3-phenylpropionate/trans-cinnamate dioxygenase ferredoxin reductase subunit|nr:FAD-dependent oxidoreductase [Solirubrobacteraceae bacterium]
MIAIVGSGAAGVSAAEALRELGFEGELCLLGSEPATPYERPALSKQFLTDQQLEPPPLLPCNALAERGVRLELGAEVVSIDAGKHELATSRGARLGYDRLLLATGAESRRLNVPGSHLAGVHYLRELADARELRAALRPASRIVIVGGGVIGLEVAASARRLGCSVTVIEVAPQLMGRIVPSELAELIADLHRARGVSVRTGTGPVAFEGTGWVEGVVLEDGEVLAADAVVVGIGVLPRTELAASAGLAIDNGVLVDERFRSSDPDIYAAGDVARVFHAGEQRHIRVEQWRPAQDQGRRAAASMMGAPDPYRDVPWMWSDQHDFEIQMTGFGFDGAEIVRRGDIKQRGGLAYLAVRDGRLIGACGVSFGSSIARTIRAAQLIIEQDIPIDTAQLRDPELDLRSLARKLAGAKREATATSGA